jgi:hypothetical protein
MKDGKFEVGDLIIGNEKANGKYGVTEEGWEGIVTESENDNGIFNAKSNDSEEETFESLEAKYFDLMQPPKKPLIVLNNKGMNNLAAAAKALQPKTQYLITIRETKDHEITVEAPNEEDAKIMGMEMFEKGLSNVKSNSRKAEVYGIDKQ